MKICASCRELRSALGNVSQAGAGDLRHSVTVAESSAPGSANRLVIAPPGYAILRELGRGGQGVVYQAHHAGTRREVALKLLTTAHADADKAERLFQRELDLIGRLDHPYIANLLDGGMHEGRRWLAMRLAEGKSLGAWLDDEPSLRDRIALVIKVCDAVSHAHRCGVLHRDLKPSNLLVDANGLPSVLDFGVATTLEDIMGVNALTATGQFVGTLAYAAPEQLRGDRRLLDLRADVYSIGVILFQALTGHFPHGVQSDPLAALTSIQHGEAKLPSSLNPELAGDLDAVILRALAKDPERRFQSVDALAKDLRAYLEGEQVSARRDDWGYVARKFLRRHRGAVTVVLAFTAFLLIGVVVLVQQRDTALLAKAEAESALAVAEASENMLTDLFGAADPNRLAGKRLHADRLLDLGGELLRGKYQDNPEARARVLLSLGTVQSTLLRPVGVATLQASERLHRVLGDEKGEADSLFALGELMRRVDMEPRWSGIVDQRREGEVYALALELYLGLYPADHSRVLETQLRLASCDSPERRDSPPGPLLDAVEAQLDPTRQDHEVLFEYLNAGRALTLARAGRITEAEPLFNQVLESRRRRLGTYHEETLAVLRSVSMVAVKLGRHAEHEELEHEREEIMEAMHGADYRLLEPLFNRFLVFRIMDRREEYQQVAAKAWRIYEADDTGRSSNLEIHMHFLNAERHLELGQLGAAQAAVDRGVASGQSFNRFRQVALRLALVKGDLETAAPFAEVLLHSRQNQYLADYLRRCGRVDEAVAMLEEVVCRGRTPYRDHDLARLPRWREQLAEAREQQAAFADWLPGEGWR